MLLAFAASLSCIGVGLFWLHSLHLPVMTSVEDYRPLQATRVLDRHGRTLDFIAKEFRLPVAYETLPKLLPQAFVAAEDSKFWDHGGVDAWSILRAAINNLRAGSRKQGGSTITQQVTRALMLGREKTFSRKITEAFLSLRLEMTLSKQDILAIYLNEIYLGEGAYGVEAAALTYFGKHASELDLSEFSLLAGLPQSPSNYSPLKNFKAARNRQRYVLNRMAEDGLISADEARAAFARKPVFKKLRQRAMNGYFAQYVRQELEREYTPEAILTGGLKVMTSVDARLQAAAFRALSQGVQQVARRHPDQPPPQAALVALDTSTGRILALIGGTDFTQNQFNRAVDARRQPGSAFKPVLYAAALEQGLAGDSSLSDQPLTVQVDRGRVWKPRNFGGTYRGKVSLTDALVHSSNVAAVRLLQQTGFPAVRATAGRLGIRSSLEDDYTLALGSSPVSLLELTSAYTAFAGEGLRHAPAAITSVRGVDGRVRPWTQPSLEQAIAPRSARWLHQALTQVVRRGTGRQVASVRGASGKTGTTDNNTDAWFVGSVPGLTAGVWVGHDRDLTLGPGEGGAVTAAPIWRAFMQEAAKL